MDILEKFFRWLGWDDTLTANVLIIAVAIIAVVYVITKWISTSKKLKNIDDVVKTAPENIREYLDGGKQSLQDSISNASEDICQAIASDKVHFAEKLAAIEKNTDLLTAQRPTVPVQQSQLLAEINSLYAMHDRDQRTIAAQKEKIDFLQSQNTMLKQQKAYMQKKLDKLTPKHEQDLSV